ncbi:hypothetical protein [Bacteroides sp.]|uniref:hypothetical protein n=1 Tax=Bacteroides sp. TaxID=29523 RepID=UPI00258A291B|nr:hypothetical protein [Bacteroides sp.]
MSTQQQQEVIDQLIDYIDKAILKNSVSNRHVAAVLAFLNEALKDKSIDLEELKKYFLSKIGPDTTLFLLKLLGGLEVENGIIADTITTTKGITGQTLTISENISAQSIDATETISSKNITASETVSTQNVDATGTVSTNMIDAIETVSGKNVLASESVAGENVTASNTVSGKNISASETVSGKNVTVSQKITTLNLLVQSLTNSYDLNVSHVATLMGTIVKDYISSESFVSGFSGEGMKIYKAINGDWNMEIDNLIVRKIFSVFELVVQKIVHQGGMIIRSAAGGKLVKVTDGGTYWKCEHDSTDDFVQGDQVLCQTFTGKSIKRYWRLVTSAGEGYFNLSKTDCEASSAPPAPGDDVAVLGNRTIATRQKAQIDCAVGDTAPYRDDYDAINSFSLAGKLITRTGNLSGITDAVFGVLSGVGFYGTNVYLKGTFILKSGKKVEEAINDGIASVQVGGRNLLANSDFSENSLSKWRGSQDNNYTLSIENSELKIVGQQGRTSAELNNSWNTAWYVAPYSFNVAGDYTISFDAYALKACTLYFRANYFTHPTYGGSVQIGTKKQRYSVVFKNDTNENSRLLGFAFSVATTLYLDNVKLELGNKATDWTPAPEDVNTRITNVETQFEIREGVISTKVTEATTAATNAKKSETSASTSASTATTKATAAASSATSASTSATTATTKANAASSSATAASGSATTAGQKATAAANSATAAATSATNAQKAAESAETILEEVTTKESSITQTAGQIATKVTEVNKKVTEATTAATTATTKATAAATSATNAKTSETNAGTKATAAANSATAAATSATNAKSSADTAAAKLTTITEKESSINQTASSITTKVTEVTTKATQAATSAANAKTSETNAGTKATAAANSATTAGTKATAAANSATAAASSATSAAASLTSVTTKQSEINAKADQITLKVTEVTTKTTQATNAAELATAMSKGKMLYRDPTFKDGSYNGTAVYLPTGVTRSYIAVTGCPNPAAKAMKFVATQFYTATDKRIGGFLFGNKSRANAVFVVRIIANIPTGRNLNVYHNSYGTGGATKWLTSTAGAGKWQEYACKVTCGASGTFSGLNHFALTGGAAPTTAAPLTWYVAYATVFDVTDVDDTPSREEIKSGMTITAGGISIFGKELSLAGKVTFSSLDSAAQSTINGKATPAQIATAKSEAISTAATDATTKANNAKSSAISTAATDATTKANNAKTAAISAAAIDATTKANNALTNARNDVAVKLGYASYTEMVNQATAKNTIINGGYIRTSLIDADTLITGSLLATKIAATEITTGKLTVTTGAKIGGWNVEGNSLSIKSAASAKILVEPSGTRFLRINDSATELLGIRADGVTGIGIYTQNVSGTCLSMIAQTGGTAVESYGSHTFGQRPGEVWNAPGVLRAARINADGGTDRVWGNGTPNFYTYKSSNGIYVITHNLGHTDYMPFVTMISDWNFLYTPEIYDNYFVVKMQSNKGSWENDSFNVMIVGRNKF